MSKLLSLIVAAVFAAASMTAIAQEKKAEKKPATAEKSTKKEPTAAQKRQQACNKQADEKKLKGDERKQFVSTCAKPPAKKTADKAKAESKPMKAEPKK